MLLNEEELNMIKGGSISATTINALSRLVSTFMKLGQVIGSSIRRAITKSYC